MKRFLILLFLAASLLGALSREEIQFLLDTEQFQLLDKHSASLETLAASDEPGLRLLLTYAQRSRQTGLALRCHYNLATLHHSLEDAVQWVQLAEYVETDSLRLESLEQTLLDQFPGEEDRIVLDYYLKGTPEGEYLARIRQLRGYNSVIEDLAKSWIDQISVERSDSLAMALLDRFEENFPLSKWAQTAYYYRLYHLSQAKRFDLLDQLIASQGSRSAEYLYISALYLLSPTYRREQGQGANDRILNQAAQMLDSALNDYASDLPTLVLYDQLSPAQWANRLALTKAKADYYLLLAGHGLYGDEADLSAMLKTPGENFRRLWNDLETVNFANNASGDLAELSYWRGKVLALPANRKYLQRAAGHFADCLALGAPRKKYDLSALQALEALKAKLGVKQDVTAWVRELKKYRGIVFSELPVTPKGYSRIAIGDYDNDGFNDLLFNGSALFKNQAGKSFADVSDTTATAGLQASGGLWGDFNLDGFLDFATISHNEDGLGESLLKNQNGTRFVKVNERAGDIDDHYPTEGAAWIDTDGLGYPSLYCANYEKWEQRNGYPDFFWHNALGYFSDASADLGFRGPDYTDNPGLAGRGVAPADFDNDGQQEILVTNYRLTRNFCWDRRDTLYVDTAALYGLAGKYKDGYYGHSIGADWGDYDNDGDLDLFVANLAHPRYIDISDISQLLRNDGPAWQVVEGDTIRYWKFTDVTQAAGITFDELHSDPLWFDPDNDGDLDLFITSVYENDRSYLYQNNGDGTFTDVTFLAGARVYNGWGNASADLDRDGRCDLVVGSGNGAKVLLNRTKTRNKSLFIKPVWNSGELVLASPGANSAELPNSPAFGTRVKLTLKAKGKTYSLIRELCSAKGTTSQSAQELHFGLGRAKLLSIEKVSP